LRSALANGNKLLENNDEGGESSQMHRRKDGCSERHQEEQESGTGNRTLESAAIAAIQATRAAAEQVSEIVISTATACEARVLDGTSRGDARTVGVRRDGIFGQFTEGTWTGLGECTGCWRAVFVFAPKSPARPDATWRDERGNKSKGLS